MSDEFIGNAAPLDTAGFSAATGFLEIDAPTLWTVLSVETSGVGFLADRRPVILFERHIFSRETSGQYDQAHPDISNPLPGGYGPSGAHQYDRLASALALDPHAALMSASWGIGQVMGFNFAAAGFGSAEDMVAAMQDTESSQLMGMANFLGKNGLDLPLKQQDWAKYARGYNGPDYAENAYDTRLASAHAKYTAGPLPDLDVRAAQLFLLYLGFQPGPVDGLLGKNTLSALNLFLGKQGKTPVSCVTPETLGLLKQSI